MQDVRGVGAGCWDVGGGGTTVTGWACDGGGGGGGGGAASNADSKSAQPLSREAAGCSAGCVDAGAVVVGGG